MIDIDPNNPRVEIKLRGSQECVEPLLMPKSLLVQNSTSMRDGEENSSGQQSRNAVVKHVKSLPRRYQVYAQARYPLSVDRFLMYYPRQPG